MDNKEDLIKESASIIEEIEDQLDKILAKKRQEIESELDENIERNKREAKVKMENLTKELAEERDAVASYRSVLSEYDENKKIIKKQIDEHLSKAMAYQPQIEKLAGETLEELKKVFELNKKLEDISLGVISKVDAMKKDLEEKFDVSPPVPETKEHEVVQNNLDLELAKLEKIKELLGKDSKVRKVLADLETESMPESIDSFPESRKQEKTLEKQIEKELISSKDKETQTDVEQKPAWEEEDVSAESLGEKLEAFRRSVEGEKNAKLTYFEYNKKMILDGKDVIAALEASVREAQRLYDKLAQMQSPKEQFFTKQEIIWHQESLREFMLTAVKMCEKENASLPQWTTDVINIGILKKILEKLNQENWSNKDFFISFSNFASDLRTAFQKRTTPLSRYLESLDNELQKE